MANPGPLYRRLRWRATAGSANCGLQRLRTLGRRPSNCSATRDPQRLPHRGLADAIVHKPGLGSASVSSRNNIARRKPREVTVIRPCRHHAPQTRSSTTPTPAVASRPASANRLPMLEARARPGSVVLVGNDPASSKSTFMPRRRQIRRRPEATRTDRTTPPACKDRPAALEGSGQVRLPRALRVERGDAEQVHAGALKRGVGARDNLYVLADTNLGADRRAGAASCRACSSSTPCR